MKVFCYDLRPWDEQDFMKKYAAKYGVEYDFIDSEPKRENWDLAKGFDALNIITTKTDSEMLEYMKNLGIKYVVTRSIGVDHIDLNAAKRLGIKVGHVSYPPNSVANYTIMLMLMCCRKMAYIQARAELQDYGLEGKIGREMTGSTIGVIGTGKIGSTVIRHLSGFGCRILAYDIYENEELKQYAEYTDLDTLYRESDIITIHAPATKENFHMIDAEAFEKCKDGFILINCARGSLIDSEAMIEALKRGKIGAAGLDVIENEFGLYYHNRMGDILDNKELALLRAMPNVIVSPHTAFYTDEAVASMVETSLQALLAMEKGEDSPLIV